MKAFEKWFDEGHICKPEDRMLLLYKVKAAEKAWRAALEEVLRVIIEESNGPNNPKDLMVWLREELEENDDPPVDN